MEVPSACVPTDDAAADWAEARQGMAHLWQELGGSIFSYGHMAYMQTHEMPWAKQVFLVASWHILVRIKHTKYMYRI
jgi:hypothetical protein